MDWLIPSAWAQSGGGGQGDALVGLLPLVLIVAVLYFMVIRPQGKRQKEHREMVSRLAVGDEVVTAGGLLGRITEVKEQFVRLQIANSVEVVVQRHTVAALMPKGTMKSV